MELTANEMKVIRRLREPIAFQTITIKKSQYGKLKRITVHVEQDEIMEEEARQ